MLFMCIICKPERKINTLSTPPPPPPLIKIFKTDKSFTCMNSMIK